MTAILIILSVILMAIIAVQVGRLAEITSSMQAETEMQTDRNSLHAMLGMLFVGGFLVFCFASAYYYRTDLFGMPGNIPASEHGSLIDTLFYITLVPTGIVFVLTHIALFWFAYKYKGKVGRKVLYIPHDNRLEVIWTAIPAVVMSLLVVGGLYTWNKVMADIPENAVAGKDYIEIEATGMQFAWILRSAGKDGLLGTKNFKLISATNDLGQDWKDVKNHDDVKIDEIVLPVGKQVRVRITARDVLHNFYLPHFRLKMDAVPGMPTYFVFKPIKTTEDRRKELSAVPEYQELNKDGKPRWSVFDYELACAEMCGQGHFSMRKVVKIVTQKEYDEWLNKQKPYYTSNIKGKEEDTYGKATTKVTEPSVKEGAQSDATKTTAKPISQR